MGHDVPPQQQQGGAPYPYPPQPQPGTVTAPGGYPAYNPAAAAAGAGPSAGAGYPPQPAYIPEPEKPPHGGMVPPGSYPPPQQQHHVAPPSGYPGAYPPPPAGVGGPAPGYVMGTPAGTAPVGGMSVEGAGPAPGQEKCGCTIGWVLFAIGFIFWPCWVAAAFVPLCTRNRSDRLAGIASTIGMLVLVVIAIIIGASSPKWRSSYAY